MLSSTMPRNDCVGAFLARSRAVSMRASGRTPGSGESASGSFFLCYGDHRDLHSFPTRRSSDLGGGDADRDGGGYEAIFERVEHRPKAALEDRKSTRLNSSHLGNSYAVFCLK